MTVPSTLKELGNEMGLDLSTMLIPSSQVSGAVSGGTDNIPSYTIYKTGANFAARANLVGLSDVAANADAAAVLQSCLDNINGSTTPRGVIVFAPNTTFTWSSVPSIRRTYASAGADDNKWLRIIGSGGSRISFTVTGNRLFKFNRQADYDGFCGVEIGNLEFDATGATSGGCILGTRDDPLDSLSRCDVRRLYFHDLIATCPTFTSANGHFFAFIWINISHPANNEGTRSFMTDIIVERCRSNGANCGIYIGGSNAIGTMATYAGTNIYGTRWRVSDFYHDSGIAAGSLSTYPATSCMQLGALAFGDAMLVERCWLRGSPDDGIEVNNFRRIVVRDCHVALTTWGGYAPVQFNYVNGVDNNEAHTQQMIFENCEYEHVGVETTAVDRAFMVQGFGNSVTTVNGGHYVFRDCTSYCSAPVNDTCAGGGSAFFCGSGIPGTIESISLENFNADSYFNHNLVGTTVIAIPVYLYKTHKNFRVRNLSVRFRGARQNTGEYFIEGARIGHDTATAYTGILDVDGFSIHDLTTARLSGSGRTYFMNLGAPVVSDLGGTLRGLKWLSTATGDTTPRGILVAAAAQLTLRKLLLDDLDYSHMPASAEALVTYQTAGQNEPPVFYRNIKDRNAVLLSPEITFTPGATTVSAQYLGHYEGLMTLTGGTVTVIEVSTDNATFRQVGTTTPASFYIDHGMYVRMTYTVVPTAKVIPRR